VNWFKIDNNVRNDPKIRAVRKRFGPEGLGWLVCLWSYIATEGSKTDPGVGLDSAGKPLNLIPLAADLDFPDVEGCRDFLAFLATIDLIDPNDWAKGTITLPAMRKRAEPYRRAVSRRRTGRPMGRPRKNPGDTPGKSAESLPKSVESPTDRLSDLGFSDGSRDVESGKSAKVQETGNAEIVEIVPRNAPEKVCESLSKVVESLSKVSLLSSTVRTDKDLLGETSTKIPDLILEPDPEADDGPDPRIGKLTVKKLIALWNLTRTPGPKCLGAVPARYERFRLAIKATPDAATWEQAIGYLNGVAWANARGGDGDHANFRADLDYLAKPGNVMKALERLAAAALPTARPARHTGRIMDSPERRAENRANAKKRDAAEDEELKAMGL